jgi:DNA polymerase-3 subunit epsilon
MVADAAPFPVIYGVLRRLLADRFVVSYNAEYDARVIGQSARIWNLARPSWRWHCAMRQYARFVGQWSADRADYVWQKLPVAPPDQAHSAAGDCRATLALIHQMAR